MSEHGEDSVIGRVTAEVNSIAGFGMLDRVRVGIVLERLKPGDRLPGGLEVISSALIDDWDQKLDKINVLLDERFPKR